MLNHHDDFCKITHPPVAATTDSAMVAENVTEPL